MTNIRVLPAHFQQKEEAIAEIMNDVSVRGTAWSVRNGKCVRPGGGVTPPPDARRGAAWRGGRCWLRAAAVLRDR